MFLSHSLSLLLSFSLFLSLSKINKEVFKKKSKEYMYTHASDDVQVQAGNHN